MRRRGVFAAMAALFVPRLSPAAPGRRAATVRIDVDRAAAAVRASGQLSAVGSEGAALSARDWGIDWLDHPAAHELLRQISAELADIRAQLERMASRVAVSSAPNLASIAVNRPSSADTMAFTACTSRSTALSNLTPSGSGIGLSSGSIESSMGLGRSPMVAGAGEGSQRSVAGPDPIAPPLLLGSARPAAKADAPRWHGGGGASSAPAALSLVPPVLRSGHVLHAPQHEGPSQ